MPKFAPATRKKSFLRAAFDGPPGAGKTRTALRVGFALALHVAAAKGRAGQPRVACIDTETGSMSKEQGIDLDGVLCNFDVIELQSFSPTEYTACIEEAGRGGYDVLIVDSLSHAWEGKDGALEIKDRSQERNKWAAWKDVTPMHRRMVEAILHAPMHVICTMRSKVEYVLEKNEQGKEVPRRVGTAPIQRPGMEYEFDLYGSIDQSHVLTVTKSRCSAVDGAIVFKPGPSFIEPVIAWLETGVAVATMPTRIMVDDATVERIVGKLNTLGRKLEPEKQNLLKRFSVERFTDLSVEQAAEYEKRLDVDLANRRKQKPADAAPAPAKAETNGHAAPSAVTPATAPTATATIGQITLNTITELKAEYFHLRGDADPAVIAEKWTSGPLAKRGVTHEKDLTEEQAAGLIDNLRGAIAKMQPAPEAAGIESRF